VRAHAQGVLEQVAEHLKHATVVGECWRRCVGDEHANLALRRARTRLRLACDRAEVDRLAAHLEHALTQACECEQISDEPLRGRSPRARDAIDLVVGDRLLVLDDEDRSLRAHLHGFSPKRRGMARGGPPSAPPSRCSTVISVTSPASTLSRRLRFRSAFAGFAFAAFVFAFAAGCRWALRAAPCAPLPLGVAPCFGTIMIVFAAPPAGPGPPPGPPPCG
jgi:hypothetical protein